MAQIDSHQFPSWRGNPRVSTTKIYKGQVSPKEARDIVTCFPNEAADIKQQIRTLLKANSTL